MKLSWPREDQIRILERYWASGHARCTFDNAVLLVTEARSIKPLPPTVFFRCPRCGRYFNSDLIDKSPDPESFEGKYEQGALLAEGGMGEVVEATRRADSVRVAAKRILPQYVKDPDVVKRFNRERRVLTSMQHPNIVRVLETFLDDRGGVIVMEYVAGGTLKAAIKSSAVSSEDLLFYFGGIVEGLRFLHGEGVIHRDLKPDNVLIEERTAKISDFGLARLLNRDTTTLTVHGTFLGTRAYAAPEQETDAAEVTPACDIFALGLIAFEIATRTSPYRKPINSSGLAAELHKALSRALSDDPHQRPLDGGELLEALRAHLHA